jgi:DNA repair photolyase
MITKNHLITRDIDLLQKLAAYQAVCVFVSISTLDNQLARIMEPRASFPQAWLAAVKALSEAGIPVGVMVVPLISGLNDYEVPSILEAAKEAGAQQVGYTVMRLPYAVKVLFTDWLEKNYPAKKEKILHHIQDIRGGKLNDPRFGTRMKGEGQYANQIQQLFKISVEKWGLNKTRFHLSSEHFQKPGDQQLSLF